MQRQAFGSVTPLRIETSDILDWTSDPAESAFELKVSPPYVGGYAFDVMPGARLCFDLVLPNDAPVLVGAMRRPISVPFDPVTLGPCGTNSEPMLSIADPEDTGVANFTVSLLPASTDTIMVNYLTSDINATGGLDYEAAAGTLLFNPGETSAQVPVTLIDDLLEEGNESFTVTLSGEVNALLGDVTATGALSDDELSVCGAPSYNQSTDRTAFLWRDCSTGIWTARYTAAGGYIRYIGSVNCDQAHQRCAQQSRGQ